MRLLLVEDEYRFAETLAHILSKNNYGVDMAEDGISGQELAETGVYDLIILDRTLPGKGGLEVLKDLRRSGLNTPVLMLSANDEVREMVEGLDSGADDYLVKPFANEELLARIRAVSRRHSDIIRNELLYLPPSLVFAPLKGEITCGKKTVKLTQKESQLLELLLKNKNQVITREQILDKVWGLKSDVEMNNIEVYLSFLRKKLKSLKCPLIIETIRGSGYCLREGGLSP